MRTTRSIRSDDNVKPREIRGAERERLWRRMREAWRVPEGYWYPLADLARRDLLALEAPSFHEALVTGKQLHATLAGQGVEHVYELLEGGRAYTMKLTDLYPRYGGDEGFWCSDAMDWIVYASHESSIAVGGSWLVPAVKAAWPEWKQYVWTSPEFF